MAGRYTDWRHRRGAQNRPDLDQYGRKLLDYLREQRANGVKTQKITRTLPDGSVVTAQFVGDHPIVEIIASTQVNDRPTYTTISGLIVRPSPEGVDQAANTAKNHVLLRPIGTDEWFPHFHSIDEVPVGYTDPHGAYGIAPGKPDLFPAGIGRYGNIDWRNADETVMVTFHGPESRYFYDPANHFRNKVYFKGQLLFDLSTVELALTGATNGQVVGACMRGVVGAGTCLLVVVRHSGTERLLQVPVSATAAARRLNPPNWMLATTLETAAVEQMQVVLTWTPGLGGATPAHPWMFNQSGTEARRMTVGSARSYEEVLSVPREEDQDPSYSVTEHLWTSGTTTTVTNDTLAQTPVSMTDDFTDVVTPSNSYTGNVTYLRVAQDTAVFDVVLDRAQTVTTDYANPWVHAAVDYVDDAPVYGYLRRSTSTTVVDYSRTMTFSRYETVTLDTGSGYETTTTTGSNDVTASRTVTTVCGGLQTDWLEYVADATVTTVNHEEAYDEDTEWTVDTVDETQTVTASGPVSYSYTRTSSTRTPLFVIGYLDLRYRLALVGRFTELISRSFTGSSTYETGDYLDGPWHVGTSLQPTTPLIPADTIDRTTTSYLTAVLSVSGNTVWSVSEHSLYPAIVTTEAQEEVWANNSSSGSRGSRVRGVSVGRTLPSGDYLLDDFTLWVTGTADPGSTASYVVNTSVPVSTTGGIDPAGLCMREAAIAGDLTAQTNDYPDTVNNVRFGAWQAYKGRYGYSMSYSSTSGLVHSYGLGDLTTGLASVQTMDVLTGSLEPRFHPVGVLTPTSIPR